LFDTTGYNLSFGAGACNDIDNVACMELSKDDPCSEMQLSQLPSFVQRTRTVQTIAMSSRQQRQELPHVSRMSSLLDDIPESLEETPPNLALDPLMHSALICDNPLSDNFMIEVATRDRMAQFWETLDSEQPSNRTSDFLSALPLRPRKLRKARSSIHPEQCFSTLSTSSLPNKLRKISRPTSGVSLSHERQTLKQNSPVLELPTGVEKIGSGIGFTYILPAAARSKASICSNVPSTCHNMLQVKLPVFALGLRLANELCKTMSKSKTRGIPHEDRKSSETFTEDSRWSLVLPVDPSSSVALTMSNSNSSSPVSDAGPLTPDTVGFEECGVVLKGEFVEGITHEFREGDPVSTLRLVSPSMVRHSEDFLL
jgi:hypothetical protein